jgi:subtilisin family serine protease
MPTSSRRHTVVLVCAAALAAPGAAGAAAYRPGDRYVPGELIVGYHSAETAAAAKSARQALGLETLRTLDGGRVQLVRLPAVTGIEPMRALLEADPQVAYAEPNFIRRPLAAVPDDPLFGQLWGLFSTGQRNFFCDREPLPPDCASRDDLASIPGADMNMPAAWDRDGDGIPDRTGSGNVVVAVIDDAFDTAHEDLAQNFIGGADLTTCSRNNLTGCSPDVRPQNADMVHGTLVAGSLGAVGNNGIGVAGAIWNVQMMPLKVGRIRDDQVQLSTDAILAAYEYARSNGARIVNASYGGPSFSQAEFEAIRALGDAGVLFVTSAGNFNSNLDYSIAAYPANYRLPNIIAVAATNRQDNIASFSQYGPLSTDIAAPGLQIVTTLPGNDYISGTQCGSGGRCGTSGTSFASPYVAGLAALMLDEYPQADPLELRARLIEGAEPGVAGGDAHELSVGGRVDGANSLGLAPRPALVLRAVRLIDGGNARLDPGETLEVEVEVQNLWQSATAIEARLQAPDGVVRVLSGPQSIPALARAQTAAVRFRIEVLDSTVAYQDLGFRVDLSAAGGYTAQRPFRQELARLAPGTSVQATLSQGLHDEFHTFHVDVAQPPPGRQLVLRSTAARDIDLLVKFGSPAQYNIDLGTTPDDDGTFFTDADCVGGGEDGNEIVGIDDPRSGTYYVTVLNFSLADALDYGLQAAFEQGAAPCNTSARGDDAGGGGGGGGGVPPTLLWLLGFALIAHRIRGGRRACARPREV